MKRYLPEVDAFSKNRMEHEKSVLPWFIRIIRNASCRQSVSYHTIDGHTTAARLESISALQITDDQTGWYRSLSAEHRSYLQQSGQYTTGDQ